MTATLNILFLAAEAEPFIKVGGLGDVAGSLPLALRGLPAQSTQGVKLDVRLVLPMHKASRVESSSLRLLVEFSITRNGGSLPVQVYETSLAGMPVYFIQGEPFLNAQSVYSRDQAEDREKYAFFSLAALDMLRFLDWQPDILHANDWHTALAVVALRLGQPDLAPQRIRSVLTVHNLPFMGGEGSDVLAAYGLSPIKDETQTLPEWARTQPLPMGLWAADAIVPVSPMYAREIQTPDFGCGLEAYLKTRSDTITGILNGIDGSSWDPEFDTTLAACFNAEDLAPRAANKQAIQQQLLLAEEPGVPLLAMIGRIDWQKGVDLTFQVLRQMADQPWQFVLLGVGDPALEEQARCMQTDFPERFRAVLRFDASLGRRMYAGTDMFLMPSRYEPCGLAQMIAMRYGSVPVVRATGGLKDTVREGKTGFVFTDADPHAMLETLRRAVGVYAHPGQWQHYQHNGMKQDFSWPSSARQYASIYRSLMPGS